MGFNLRRWGLASAVGLHLASLNFTLRRWVLPFVVGFYPSSLGFTLRRWVLPFVVGLHPSSLGFTLRRWVLPPSPLVFSSLCYTPFAVWFYPPPLGSTQRVRSPSCGSTRRRQVRKAPAGLNTLVLFNTKAVSCWSVRRRRFDLFAWVSSSSCHRRGPRLSSLGPTHCPRVVVRRLVFVRRWSNS